MIKNERQYRITKAQVATNKGLEPALTLTAGVPQNGHKPCPKSVSR